LAISTPAVVIAIGMAAVVIVVGMAVVIFVYVTAFARIGFGIALNDFVQFASVEPNASALRTIINFDALPIAD